MHENLIVKIDFVSLWKQRLSQYQVYAIISLLLFIRCTFSCNSARRALWKTSFLIIFYGSWIFCVASCRGVVRVQSCVEEYFNEQKLNLKVERCNFSFLPTKTLHKKLQSDILLGVSEQFETMLIQRREFSLSDSFCLLWRIMIHADNQIRFGVIRQLRHNQT